MTMPPVPPVPPDPPTLNYANADPDRVYLRFVATQQRNIMICILIYIVAVIGQFVFPEPLRLILGLCVFVVMIFALVCVFRLATRLYGTGIGVLMGILTLIPLVGLIVLLIVNGRATTILKQHGQQVGLLGADPKAIDRT